MTADASPARPRRGPIDPRLLRRAAATRRYLALAAGVGVLTAGLTIVQAWALGTGIAGVFDSVGSPESLAGLGWAVGVLAFVFAAKALLSWGNTLLAHRAAADVKAQLRRDIVLARLSRPLDSRESAAGLATLVTQGLDALDGFYGKYLPQLALAVTVPVIVGVAIAWADLTSAIIIALTLPLIPVFMALVGWTTEARTKKRWASQQRLAHHFADLVAGLPTLQVFGRASRQAIGLERTESAHRAETMGTLKISFLSALVLELLATLSVAVVAVTVGFRAVAGDLDLATALFVLVLTPEAYLPVRQVGVLYHDAADGMAAADSAFRLIDAASPDVPPAKPVRSASPDSLSAAPSSDSPDLIPTASGSDSLDALPAPPGSAISKSPAGFGLTRRLRVRTRSSLAEPKPATDVEIAHTSDADAERSSFGNAKPAGDLEIANPTAAPATADATQRPLRNPKPETDVEIGDLARSADAPAVGGRGGVVVVLRGVGHTYPGASGPAVSGVSFEVRHGEFVALTGPSGGGKTTILHALAEFLSPTEGTIHTRSDADAVGWRARVAWVGQNPGMIAGTIADNVRLGDPDASDAAVEGALTRAGGADLDPRRPVGDEAEGLSAGERRRVATARALLRLDAGADVLLLDEPTAGLDADAEAVLLASLRTTGVTAIVVSHRARVLDAADRVVTIGGGA